AVDGGGGAPVGSVGVSIGALFGATTRYYQQGVGFVAGSTEYFNPAVLNLPSWTYTDGNLVFNAGRRYLVRTVATDLANNVENYAAVPQQSFLFDNFKPTAAVTSFNNGDYIALGGLTI